MSPQRIQRKRTKGWRIPEDAVYVGRPTDYCNPWTITDAKAWGVPGGDGEHRRWAVSKYADELMERGGTGEIEFVTIAEIRDRLRGRDLVCWCPLDQACHADVLLEIANGGAS